MYLTPLLQGVLYGAMRKCGKENVQRGQDDQKDLTTDPPATIDTINKG